jgi:hypothetical protein
MIIGQAERIDMIMGQMERIDMIIVTSKICVMIIVTLNAMYYDHRILARTARMWPQTTTKLYYYTVDTGPLFGHLSATISQLRKPFFVENIVVTPGLVAFGISI